ncbi:MAG: hypothetical protein JWO38_1746 [Gemmataceae bacterium]|nr:hypothetical protein [Gemmataceae bacterium]
MPARGFTGRPLPPARAVWSNTGLTTPTRVPAGGTPPCSRRSPPWLSGPPRRVRLSLHFLTLDQANRLNGRRVTVTLLVRTPVYCDGERTIVGGADRPDEVDRNVILRGERYDVDEGEWITVTGTLRLVSQGATVVNGVFVPGWTEIRVEEE